MEKQSNFEFGEQLKQRTKLFALRIIKLFQSLPKTNEAKIIGKQLLRAATSVAANYRAACRARSDAEFYSKMCIVVEEADETLFWPELLEEASIFQKEKLEAVKKEPNALVAITVKIRSNIRLKKN